MSLPTVDSLSDDYARTSNNELAPRQLSSSSVCSRDGCFLRPLLYRCYVTNISCRHQRKTSFPSCSALCYLCKWSSCGCIADHARCSYGSILRIPLASPTIYHWRSHDDRGIRRSVAGNNVTYQYTPTKTLWFSSIRVRSRGIFRSCHRLLRPCARWRYCSLRHKRHDNRWVHNRSSLHSRNGRATDSSRPVLQRHQKEGKRSESYASPRIACETNWHPSPCRGGYLQQLRNLIHHTCAHWKIRYYPGLSEDNR